MAQTCFGCSGGFGPISLPLVQGMPRGVPALVSLTVSMVFRPFFSEKAERTLAPKLVPYACRMSERSDHNAPMAGRADLRSLTRSRSGVHDSASCFRLAVRQQHEAPAP
jgi:hypothetical protein